MNLWMKRVLGAGALGGGLLALTAGAAGAQEVSAEVRVCADGRGLSGLLGSCRGSGTSVTAGAGRGDGATGVRVRARAGIGVLDSGPIVSGNQVDAGIGSISPSVAGSGALPFTGAAGDLLALLAPALLIVGVLVGRATRPAAATEGGADR